MTHTAQSVRKAMAREVLGARRAGLPLPVERLERLRGFLPPVVTLATGSPSPHLGSATLRTEIGLPADDTSHALFAAYLDALIRAKEATDPEEYEAAAREADRLWAMLKEEHEGEGESGSLATLGTWQEYRGPRGGRGWVNPETGHRRYNSRDPNQDYGSAKPSDPYKDWTVPGEELTPELKAHIDRRRADAGLIPPEDAKVEKYDPAIHGRSPQGHAGYTDVGGKKLPVAQRLPEGAPKPTADAFADYKPGSQPRPDAPKPQAPPGELRHNPDLDAMFDGPGGKPKPAQQPAPAQPTAAPPGKPEPARVSVSAGGGQPQAATPAAAQAAPMTAPPGGGATTPPAPRPRISPEEYRKAAVEWIRQNRPHLLEPEKPKGPYISRTPAKIHHDEPPAAGAPTPAAQAPLPLQPSAPVAPPAVRQPAPVRPQVPAGPAVAQPKAQPAPAAPPTPADPHEELVALGRDLERHASGHAVPDLQNRIGYLANKHDLYERELLQKAAEAHHAAQGPATPHPKDAAEAPVPQAARAAEVLRPAPQPVGPARRYGHAHTLLRRQAQAAGLDLNEVQSVADDILRQHHAATDQHNELLRWVRKHGGADVIRRGKNKFVGGQEDDIRGLDEVAQEAAGLFPGRFREPTAANGGEHHEQLQAMLQEGDRPTLTPEQAFQKAMEQAEEEAYHKRLKKETEDDGEITPFSADASLIAFLSALPAEVTTITVAGEHWERVGVDSEGGLQYLALLNNDGWQAYHGPRGGVGWRNVSTGRVVYTSSPTAPGYARRQVQSSAKRALELSGQHAAHLRGTGAHPLSDTELQELADHVQALPVHTLRSLKNHIMGTWGNVRRRAEMVEALTGHVKRLVDTHQALEADYHRKNVALPTDDMTPAQKREYWAGRDQEEGNTPSMRADRLAGFQQAQADGGGFAHAAPAGPKPQVPTPAEAPQEPVAESEAGPASGPVPFPVEANPPYNPRHTYYKSGPVRDVPLDRLVATQEHINPEYLAELLAGGKTRDANEPKVVKVGDKYHIENGHHRASVAHARGEKSLKAQVFEYDPATGKTKPAAFAQPGLFGSANEPHESTQTPAEKPASPSGTEDRERPLGYEPVPESVSDEDYDRMAEEKKKQVQAGLALPHICTLPHKSRFCPTNSGGRDCAPAPACPAHLSYSATRSAGVSQTPR